MEPGVDASSADPVVGEVGVGVGEKAVGGKDEPVWRREGCFAGRGDGGIERGIGAPQGEESRVI